MTSATVRIDSDAGARRRLGAWLTLVIPALVAYVPLLLTQPGEVGADTKTYLYLNPGKVLAEAPYVWNSQIGMGTVTHQYIGYLWPMGPFYWVFDQLGVPDWVAQRLWLGTVMVAAGLGVRYLCRTLGWGNGGQAEDGTDQRAAWGGVLVASLAYMLSPYLLEYAARISVILLPWAALPWMIALTARALRRGGWRYPALFALVVLTVGGINATALIMIGTGPLLYVAWAVFVEHEVSVREALATVGRIGVLTIGTSLWWIAGLWAEGKYGLPVTRYTETYRTVAEVSSAQEVLRGLGYWFFYGDDKLGPWTAPSATYTTNLAAVSLSYAVPVLAIVAAALVRWRYRALFIGIVVVGAFTAVASHPWSNPSLLGALFKAFSRTDAGLALRSTPRAVPLVVLGLAMLLGAGVSALGRLRPSWSVAVSAVDVGRALRQPVDALDRSDGGRQPRAPRADPHVLGAGGRLPAEPGRRHPGARGPRLGLRQLPVGQHRRPHHARPHGPPVRRPRAVPVRLGAVGRAARRLRHPLRRERHGSAVDRADRPPHGRG